MERIIPDKPPRPPPWRPAQAPRTPALAAARASARLSRLRIDHAPLAVPPPRSGPHHAPSPAAEDFVTL